MKIHTGFDQKSLEWLRVRVGKVTASELSNLLTPEFKPRTGETPFTYLCTKLAEVWRGEPLPSFGAWATDQGELNEENARAWFELRYDAEIQQVAFVETDDGTAGCSPDGLIGGDGGIEIKAPQHVAHMKCLISGAIPKEYLPQIHGSMYVTGRAWWVFLSYRPGLPPFVLRVARDEAIQRKIKSALDAFNADFSKAMLKLKLHADNQK